MVTTAARATTVRSTMGIARAVALDVLRRK
jgi:hypothetical protein